MDELNHYSIEGKENNLIKSILENRMQYVEIDGFISETIPANNCCVLQGSKLSSLLYVLYCNEIPLLQKLVGSRLMPSLTNKFYTFDISKISHNIIQYVDDSTNIVASSSHIDLQNYINTYFLVLEEY